MLLLVYGSGVPHPNCGMIVLIRHPLPTIHKQVDAVAKASQGMSQALISLDTTQNPLVT